MHGEVHGIGDRDRPMADDPVLPTEPIAAKGKVETRDEFHHRRERQHEWVESAGRHRRIAGP